MKAKIGIMSEALIRIRLLAKGEYVPKQIGQLAWADIGGSVWVVKVD